MVVVKLSISAVCYVSRRSGAVTCNDTRGQTTTATRGTPPTTRHKLTYLCPLTQDTSPLRAMRKQQISRALRWTRRIARAREDGEGVVVSTLRAWTLPSRGGQRPLPRKSRLIGGRSSRHSRRKERLRSACFSRHMAGCRRLW